MLSDYRTIYRPLPEFWPADLDPCEAFATKEDLQGSYPELDDSCIESIVICLPDTEGYSILGEFY